VRPPHQRPVGDVEADRVEPARKDALRRLGIDPDVELGGGRHVAPRDRPAHQNDPLELRLELGIAREKQRDVVSGPVATRVTGVGLSATVFATRSIACSGSGCGGGDRSGPSSPFSACT
jgi:hypothetical protein